MASMHHFDYELPSRLIAQHAAEPRDSARLLVDRGPGLDPGDRVVADLPSLLRPGDALVVNDTKVIPARLRGRKASGGEVEILVLEPIGDGWWEALVRPSRRVPAGTAVDAGPIRIEVGAVLESGRRLVRPDRDGAELLAALDEVGQMPYPPYVHEGPRDPDRYQTVYASTPGSAAAPTAGLHFTPELLAACRGAGARVVALDLRVGLDTFRPVTVDDPADHRIHTEAFTVPESTWAVVQAAERVVAVGTTTARALESVATCGRLAGRTGLFIRPSFDFAVVDVLLTNFHLPRSSLLLLVAAFVGDRWRTLYETAIGREYRFLSFGDAMLLERS